MGVLQEDYHQQNPEPRKGWLVVVAVALAAASCAVLWLAVQQNRPQTPTRVFANASLGCRFEYPSDFTEGPNFIRAGSGAFLTIERHTLEEAKKDWVAELPDVLFPQVRLQLDQGYRDLEEISRSHLTIGGRPALQVELKGKAGFRTAETRITALVTHTEAWAYVMRAYSSERDGASDRRAFDTALRSLEFLPDPSEALPR